MSLCRTAVFAVLAWGVVAHPVRGDAGAEPVVLREALFAHVGDEDAGPPPVHAAAWQRVSLPDRWSSSRPGLGGFGWYRFFVSGPRPADDRVGLLLERVNMNAEAYANGVPVGSGGRMQLPVARNSNRPLYWVLPGALLDRERNAIDVRLYAYPNDLGTLGPVRVGPDALLRPAHAGDTSSRSSWPRWGPDSHCSPRSSSPCSG